jgi:hypothetical protein
MVKATNPHRLHPTSISYVYKVFQHLDTLLMGIWVCPYTVTPVQVGSGFEENWGRAEPEFCCNVMVKAPNLLGVHPTSMSYVYKVFQQLDMLWMGIWVHPYTVTPVQFRGGF